MNILCVGGPADGRRVVIPDGVKHYEVAEPAPISSVWKSAPLDVKIHRYNFFDIHPVTRASVFAHESLTPTQIMEALMDGYREEKP